MIYFFYVYNQTMSSKELSWPIFVVGSAILGILFVEWWQSLSEKISIKKIVILVAVVSVAVYLGALLQDLILDGTDK